MKRKYIFVLIFIVVFTISFMLYNGVIWFNNPSFEKYPIRGVDVSTYQGEIDWNVLSAENIKFAFIKATEGSSFIDQNFLKNYESSTKTNLKIGAYHFFSYDSCGKTQGENFINTVPNDKSLLPPVIDIEFYGDKEKNIPNIKSTKIILNDLIESLESNYNKKPIIYATKKSYDLYIKNDYDGYHIWIRDIFKEPMLSDNREWIFWQYSNREVLKGYKGVEKYIDMNVFNGSLEELERLCNNSIR